jgi:putative phosphotransacetylase
MSDKKIEIEGSGKHCHVTRGFELEVKKALSQPGQFATPHKVTIVGPRRSTELSILGPCRKVDQFELSMTDATALGFTAPIRESGDVKGTPGCKVVGPKGEVELSEGVMIAKRHVHFTPEDAEELGITDRQVIQVKVGGERGVIFDEVVARVHPEFAKFMHVDYDELNAAGISGPEPTGEMIY